MTLRKVRDTLGAGTLNQKVVIIVGCALIAFSLWFVLVRLIELLTQFYLLIPAAAGAAMIYMACKESKEQPSGRV